MPTGSYDSSVVSVFTSATQPLSIFSDNISTVPFAFQPLNIVINTPFYYIPPPPIPISIIISPSINNVIEISSADTFSPQIEIFLL